MQNQELEKLVEKVFKSSPSGLIQEWNKGYDKALIHCREDLKQAISSGVLCVPLTVEEIENIIRSQPTRHGYYCGNPTKVAETIHTAQTKKPTE